MQRPLTIALAGNPNSGKSTLFNALTGAHQHVGNYPGITVDKKEGRLQGVGRDVRVVDLPGLSEQGDVSDWLATGHAIDELCAQVAAEVTP